MFSAKKTRRIYQSPHTKLAEIDLEGLVCGSIRVQGTVQEWNNRNYSTKPAEGETIEPFYFES